MRGTITSVMRDDLVQKREEEIDWTLQAIAGAIASGKLPPDDAAAWARIAACEVEACDRCARPLASAVR
jgi:hypothetical protein